MPEKQTQNRSKPGKIEQVLVGTWNAVKPEGQGKTILEIYDTLKFSKFTKEEQKVADKVHVFLKNNPTLVGWGAIATEAALLAGVVAGFRKLRHGKRAETATGELRVSEATQHQPEVYVFSPHIDVARSDLPNSLGQLMDSQIARLLRMDEDAVLSLLHNVESGIPARDHHFAAYDLPSFFLQNLSGRVFALPDDRSRKAFMAMLVADGAKLWNEFIASGPKDITHAVIQEGTLRWIPFEQFLLNGRTGWNSEWFYDIKGTFAHSKAPVIIDYVTQMTGFSLPRWMRIGGHMVPDTGAEMIRWLMDLASMGV